jgi:hypothetical protein
MSDNPSKNLAKSKNSQPAKPTTLLQNHNRSILSNEELRMLSYRNIIFFYRYELEKIELSNGDLKIAKNLLSKSDVKRLEKYDVILFKYRKKRHYELKPRALKILKSFQSLREKQ